ncbi:hypothetical protein EDB82DRAFT_473033 [Fusarium venenatum]|uniref:uncharacterized protein n=1 Tax=Fusarium venenatum TaxID=56646 RepID=UPI001D4A5683|nr:hypothetical protein EDB82DRAFT_473033 [Fusarium venenatum]
MKVIRHEIDPKGDLLIVLKHPNTLNLMPDPPTKHESYRPPHPYYDDPSDDEEVEIEFRVCSLRMIQSSTLFKKMFGGPSKEAVEEATASSHLRKVSATDWNGDALAVVLNIIHDRTGENDVPQEPSTFLLAHITVIVDNYRCEESKRVLENTPDLTLINTNDLPMVELLKMIERMREEIILDLAGAVL